MTQFNAPVARRSGGELDVYTGLLGVALLVLAAGVAYMAMTNIEHSSDPGQTNGSMIKLVQSNASGGARR